MINEQVSRIGGKITFAPPKSEAGYRTIPVDTDTIDAFRERRPAASEDAGRGQHGRCRNVRLEAYLPRALGGDVLASRGDVAVRQ
jgi:hypothetical protein